MQRNTPTQTFKTIVLSILLLFASAHKVAAAQAPFGAEYHGRYFNAGLNKRVNKDYQNTGIPSYANGTGLAKYSPWYIDNIYNGYHHKTVDNTSSTTEKIDLQSEFNKINKMFDKPCANNEPISLPKASDNKKKKEDTSPDNMRKMVLYRGPKVLSNAPKFNIQLLFSGINEMFDKLCSNHRPTWLPKASNTKVVPDDSNNLQVVVYQGAKRTHNSKANNDQVLALLFTAMFKIFKENTSRNVPQLPKPKEARKPENMQMVVYQGAKRTDNSKANNDQVLALILNAILLKMLKENASLTTDVPKLPKSKASNLNNNKKAMKHPKVALPIGLKVNNRGKDNKQNNLEDVVKPKGDNNKAAIAPSASNKSNNNSNVNPKPKPKNEQHKQNEPKNAGAPIRQAAVNHEVPVAPPAPNKNSNVKLKRNTEKLSHPLLRLGQCEMKEDPIAMFFQDILSVAKSNALGSFLGWIAVLAVVVYWVWWIYDIVNLYVILYLWSVQPSLWIEEQ